MVHSNKHNNNGKYCCKICMEQEEEGKHGTLCEQNHFKYDLSHLTQGPGQIVVGPIQDDETLFLYSIIRGNRLTRIFEIGSLNGYSAKNFCAALAYTPKGVLYTCDINPVPKLASNHIIITKDARFVTATDVENNLLDLIFLIAIQWRKLTFLIILNH